MNPAPQRKDRELPSGDQPERPSLAAAPASRTKSREARTPAGLVLSGGGNLGAIQVGILRAIYPDRFEPSLIVGTSIGALNAAILAFYPNEEGLERLVSIWARLHRRIARASNPINVLTTAALRRNCLIEGSFIRDILRKHLPSDDFGAAELSLSIVATDLLQGTKHVFTSGSVSSAVLASTAVPGLLPPVEIDGRIYVDGGLVANLDMETTIDAGAKEILAIDVSGMWSLGRPRSILGIVSRSLGLLIHESTSKDIERFRARAPMTVLRVDAQDIGPRDFRHSEELIAAGEEIGREMVRCCFDAEGNLVPGVIDGLVAKWFAASEGFFTDPVCGMSLLPLPAGVDLLHYGTNYHFCSSACKKQFEAEPARYVGEASPASAFGKNDGSSSRLDW